MIHIRQIEPRDNAAIAQIIRTALDEFKIVHEGTVYTDPTTDEMYQLFQKNQSAYFIAEENGEILGGAGVLFSDALPHGYAEFSRLYLDQKARGKQLGKRLTAHCINWAKENGLSHLYLESFPELGSAVHLYEKIGFTHLSHPLGQSGHASCTIWMELEL